MVNLLTPKHRAALTRLYLSRLATIVATTLISCAAITILLIVPSYLIIHADADQVSGYVQSVTDLATQRAKGQSPETLQKFQEQINFLTTAAQPPVLAHVLELTTQDRPSGVSISSITTNLGTGGRVDVSIEGTARTRAELIAYANTLKKIPELSNVVVPVSALVADIDSSFTLTCTWTKPKTP